MTVPAGLGSNNSNFVAGRTFAEILQRIVNADAWGQSTSGLEGAVGPTTFAPARQSDGSTTGWQMLGLFDAQSAGATIPAFVKTRFNNLMTTQLNTNGTWDYQVDGTPASGGSMTRVGVSLQALAFMGVTVTGCAYHCRRRPTSRRTGRPRLLPGTSMQLWQPVHRQQGLRLLDVQHLQRPEGLRRPDVAGHWPSGRPRSDPGGRLVCRLRRQSVDESALARTAQPAVRGIRTSIPQWVVVL